MKASAHHSVAYATVVALFTVAMAFAGSAQQDKTPATALADAEARWQAHKPRAYEFTIVVRCFCRGISKTPPRFRVENGATRPVQELALDRQFYSSYDTIDKLFAAIRERMSFGQDKISVEYDPELGYPIKADVDPRRYVFDDELFLQVIDFRKVDKANADDLAKSRIRTPDLAKGQHALPAPLRGLVSGSLSISRRFI